MSKYVIIINLKFIYLMSKSTWKIVLEIAKAVISMVIGYLGGNAVL